MSTHKHKNHKTEVRCMVVTISDTRTEGTDKSGQLMVHLLEQAGHKDVVKDIVQDEEAVIKLVIQKECQRDDVDVILTNGGTGISYRDVTIETIRQLLDKELQGFGELFRMLSYEEDIGSAAMMSRAIADRKSTRLNSSHVAISYAVFCLKKNNTF